MIRGRTVPTKRLFKENGCPDFQEVDMFKVYVPFLALLGGRFGYFYFFLLGGGEGGPRRQKGGGRGRFFN